MKQDEILLHNKAKLVIMEFVQRRGVDFEKI